MAGATASSTWKHKVEVYKKCGWTEEEVLAAFRKFPRCMLASESKILGAWTFWYEKWDSIRQFL